MEVIMPIAKENHSLNEKSQESPRKTSNNDVINVDFIDKIRNPVPGWKYNKQKNTKIWPSCEEIGYNLYYKPLEPKKLKLPNEDRITILMNLYGLTREQAIKEDARLSAKFDESAAPSPMTLSPSAKPVQGRLSLPQKAEVLYANRPDRKMDPITFYNDYWAKYDGLYQDDLGRLDPALVPAIRSYCQRMRKKFPDRADEYDAKNYGPPVRPPEAKKSPSITAEPGTVEYALQRQKISQRERTARYRARSGISSPFSNNM